MIIGNGNIARVLKDKPNITFFAAGTSNSGETRFSEFEREANLLFSQPWHFHLVYFSSLAIYRTKTPYTEHKKNMEKLIRNFFKSYTIVRLEIIQWGRNPTTIHNVFRQKLTAGENIEVRNETRYIVTLDEFNYWMNLIPVGEKNEMNIPGQCYTIKQILEMVKNNEL